MDQAISKSQSGGVNFGKDNKLHIGGDAIGGSKYTNNVNAQRVIIVTASEESDAGSFTFNESALNIGDIFNPESWTRPYALDDRHQQKAFVGRDAELQRIHQLLGIASSTNGKVALVGFSGIGKSVIAAAYIKQFGNEENFTGGVLWANLGEAGVDDVHNIINQWAKSAYQKDFLRLKVADNKEAIFEAMAVRYMLQGHGSLLVILDDVRRTESISPLLQALPDEAFIILTTQDRSVASAFVEPERHIEIGSLDITNSIALLRSYIDELDDELLAELAYSVESHPQTLRLIASNIAKRSTLERRIEAINDVIHNIERGELDSPMRSALDFAYEEVATEKTQQQLAQRCLRLMGLLCPNEADVSTELLAYLWEISIDEAASLLEEVLIQGSWVTATSEGRWTQHALVRSFLRSKLEHNEELEGMFRYVEFMLEWLNQIEAEPDIAASLNSDLPHAHYICSFLAEGLSEATDFDLTDTTLKQIIDHDVAAVLPNNMEWLPICGLRFAYVLSTCVVNYGDVQPIVVRWLTMGIVAARLLSKSEDEIFLLVRWYQFVVLSDNLDEALEILRYLDTKIDPTIDVSGQLFILSEVGVIQQRLGKSQCAINTFEQAAIIAEEHSTSIDHELRINLYLNYAECNISGSRYDLALHQLRLAERVIVHVPDNQFLSSRLATNLSYVYSEIGEYEEALKVLEQLQIIYDQPSDAFVKMRILNSMALTLMNLGELNEARKVLEDTVKLLDKNPVQSLQVAVLNNFSLVALRQDNLDEAYGYIKRAEELLDIIHDKSLEARTTGTLGMITYSMGDSKQALAYLQRSLMMLHDVRETTIATQTIGVITKIYQTTGQANQGIDFFKQLLPAVQSFDIPNSEVAILSSLALLNYTIDDVTQARHYLNTASSRADLISEPTDRGTILSLLADSFLMLGEPLRAVRLLEDALLAWKQTSNQIELVNTLLALGFINFALRELADAQEYLEEASPLIEKSGSIPNQFAYYNVRGLLRLEKQQFDEALEDFERTRQFSETIDNQELIVTAANNIANLYLRSDRVDLALREFERVQIMVQDVERPDLQATVLCNLGMTYAIQKNMSKAKANIRNAIEILTSNDLTTDGAGQSIELLQFILTLLRYADGNFNLNDAPSLHQTLSTVVHSTSWKMAEVMAQMITVSQKEADRWFKEQIASLSGDKTIVEVLRLYRTLLSDAEMSTLAEAFAKAGDHFENDYMYHWWGRLHLTHRGHASALSKLNRAVELAPKNSFYYSDRGWAYRGLGDYDASRRDFEYAIQLAPDTIEAHLGLGVVEFESGNTVNAFPALSRVIELQPSNILAYQWRGTAFLELDDIPSALEDIDSAIQLDKEQGAHYYWRALILLRKGEVKAALDDMNRVYEIDPPNTAERVFTLLWRGVIRLLNSQIEYSQADWKNAKQQAQGLLSSFQQHLLLAFHAVLTERKERAYEEYRQCFLLRHQRHAILTQIRHMRLLAKLLPNRLWLPELADWLEQQVPPLPLIEITSS